MPTCTKCGAEILWALTAQGRRMPVDLEPRGDGNLAAYRDHTGRLRARVVTDREPMLPYERPAMPHFATCPGQPAREATPRRSDGAIPLGAARDARRRREFAERRGVTP